MIEYKILNQNDIEEINKLEKIRIKSYNSFDSNYYKDGIINNKLIAIEVLLDNKIIGGAYIVISKNTFSITIERIFILEEYRHNKYASDLLDYIINKRQYFEEATGILINKCMAEPSNNDLIEFYKKNGFTNPNSIGIMSKPLLYDMYQNNNRNKKLHI